MSDLSLLMDMGFSESKAEKALQVTGNKGVEPAMEWLLAHADEADHSIELPTLKLGSDDEMMSAKSIQCDECGKKFRTDSEVEFHAVKTNHTSFSESSEEVKPLSDAEKKEQIKKLETIIKQRRAEKAEQEKKEALEREKNRRKTGQEITQVKQKLAEQEMKQLAEQKRLEKLEDKLARQRVLEDIERDRQARREKFNMAGQAAAATSPTAPPVATFAPAVPSQNYDQCRIQVRLMNGQCLTHSFSPKEELNAVRLFIEMNRTDGAGPFSLMTNFPKKVFNDEDMNTSLQVLGLVPSAVLILCKPQ